MKKNQKKTNKAEIKKGTKMEMEHTKSKKVARKIAKDHLKEIPNYYNSKTGLPAMEKKIKRLNKKG